MTDQSKAEIAIIGAGVIGLTIALRLAAEGRDVLVIDPNEPGSGASYGNAGTLATYACSPVGTPAVLRNLPWLLFAGDSPFAIRLAGLPALLPWLLRFAVQSLPSRARANAAVIAALLADAVPAWKDLAAAAGVQDLMRQGGCLYLYDDEAALSRSGWDMELRRQHGIRQEVLSADEVGQLEPQLPRPAGGAVFFPDALHISDPGAVMRRLAAAATAHGARFVAASVGRIERRGGGVRLTGDALVISASRVVVAAGAHSRALAAQAGDPVPLDTERGYHIEYDMPEPLLARPVCPAALGFYLVPMQGRLRVAGTVELGGLGAALNPRRTALLDRGARRFFPQLCPPSRQWLGFRPSMPDSIPVIGPSKAGTEVVYAFGHGHLGLTLAPLTARLVADAIAGRGEPDRLRPYAAQRFA